MGRPGVRTWLLSVVHNRAIDQLRSQASRRRTQERIEASAPRSQPSDAFSEVLRRQPQHAAAKGLRGLCAFQLQRYDEALADLLQAMDLGISRWAVFSRGQTDRRTIARVQLAAPLLRAGSAQHERHRFATDPCGFRFTGVNL